MLTLSQTTKQALKARKFLCPHARNTRFQPTAFTISEHLVLVAALGIDSQDFKHPLGPMEGAQRCGAGVD
jgi:hypothetical protein